MARTIASVLSGAKAAIAQKGFCQNELQDLDTGAMCMRGAIFYAITGEARWPLEIDDYKLAMKADERLAATVRCKHLPDWNNTPGRRLQTVLRAFDRATEKSR